MRWWARFAVRRHSPDATFLLDSEREAFSSLVAVTDVCVETRTSGEVWVEVLDERQQVHKLDMGRIDEAGLLHVRRSSVYDAKRSVERIVADLGERAEVEECVALGQPLPITGFEVWVLVPRPAELLEGVVLLEGVGKAAHAYHRVLAAVVRVG